MHGSLRSAAREGAVSGVRSRARAADRAAAALPARRRSAGRSMRCAICRSACCAGCSATRTSTPRTTATCWTSAACVPRTSTTVDDLRAAAAARSRHRARDARLARSPAAPPHAVIKKSTSGTTGEPVVVKYNAESRHWRDATRWRGYGWAGYRIGMRALHYWGFGAAADELDRSAASSRSIARSSATSTSIARRAARRR